MASKIKLACLGALALLVAGCSNASGPRSLYYWDGTYSSSLYSYLNEDGDATEQISRLENANFDKEAQNFPESREFINFIKGSKNLTPKKQSKKEGAKDEK